MKHLFALKRVMGSILCVEDISPGSPIYGKNGMRANNDTGYDSLIPFAVMNPTAIEPTLKGCRYLFTLLPGSMDALIPIECIANANDISSTFDDVSAAAFEAPSLGVLRERLYSFMMENQPTGGMQVNGLVKNWCVDAERGLSQYWSFINTTARHAREVMKSDEVLRALLTGDVDDGGGEHIVEDHTNG